ncbi:Branched-chain-amino-acid aminotransferase, cytosolic [Dirofilaria immitis]|nr:Branched-chain-amino-acid aminotransferase, cytosolic [Dirofilaria immitis]
MAMATCNFHFYVSESDEQEKSEDHYLIAFSPLDGVDKRMLKDAEEGKGKPKSSKTSNSTEFSISDIQFDVPIEYIKLGTTIQNIGLMIGAIVAGNLADIFGRKKILLSFTVGLIIFLVATPFSPSFIVFTILRFFDMIFTGGKHCVCNPYFMENLPDKHRMWVATVVTYSPNYIVLAGIAYMCKKWKILAWTAAAITISGGYAAMVNKKGKGEKASKAAIYIRKWDEKLTPERKERIITAVQEAAKEEACDKIEDGFLILFSTSFISYGIAYNMDALAGTVYINVIILGAARWAINILAAGLEFSIRSVGRRLLHLIAVGFIAIIMGIIFIIYIFTWPKINTYKEVVKAGGTGEELIHAIITFTRYASLLAAAMCTELFVLDAVQPTELFPTPVRSAGIAFIQTFNRLGTIVSPLVFIPVSALPKSKHWPPAPFLLMFLTSTADFLLYFFLVPETRGKKLPDNMPDEAQTPRENHTQNTESMKNVKMKGDNADSFSPSRQDKRNAKDNEERRKRNKKTRLMIITKEMRKRVITTKKERGNGKKESEEDRKKMRENEERGAEQKSNEGQSSKTESRESEERKDK